MPSGSLAACCRALAHRVAAAQARHVRGSFARRLASNRAWRGSDRAPAQPARGVHARLRHGSRAGEPSWGAQIGTSHPDHRRRPQHVRSARGRIEEARLRLRVHDAAGGGSPATRRGRLRPRADRHQHARHERGRALPADRREPGGHARRRHDGVREHGGGGGGHSGGRLRLRDQAVRDGRFSLSRSSERSSIARCETRSSASAASSSTSRSSTTSSVPAPP